MNLRSKRANSHALHVNRRGTMATRPLPKEPKSEPKAPLTTLRDLDKRNWLEGVKTFNFHPHLPHYALTTDDPVQSMFWLNSPLICHIRIRSQKRETGSSTCFSGCLRMATAQATSCLLTRRYSPLFSVVTNRWRTSGGTLRRRRYRQRDERCLVVL